MHQTAGVHICVSRAQGQQGAPQEGKTVLNRVDRQDAASSVGISPISFLKGLQHSERHEVECIL